MRPVPSGPLGLRRWKNVAVVCFVLLLSAAGLERRLSDLDFDTDTEWVLDNDESIDGDEVFNRLITLADTPTLVPPNPIGIVGRIIILAADPEPPLRVLDRPDPRAPPAPLG